MKIKHKIHEGKHINNIIKRINQNNLITTKANKGNTLDSSFEWHAHFKAGRVSVDDEHSRRPRTSRMKENVEKI